MQQVKHLSSQFLSIVAIRRPIWPSVFFKNRILLMILFLDPAVLCYNTTMWVQPYKNCKEDT